MLGYGFANVGFRGSVPLPLADVVLIVLVLLPSSGVPIGGRPCESCCRSAPFSESSWSVCGSTFPSGIPMQYVTARLPWKGSQC